MKKCAQSFLIKLLSALVCMALCGPAAAAQTTPTPGQNINRVSGVWPVGFLHCASQNGC